MIKSNRFTAIFIIIMLVVALQSSTPPTGPIGWYLRPDRRRGNLITWDR